MVDTVEVAVAETASRPNPASSKRRISVVSRAQAAAWARGATNTARAVTSLAAIWAIARTAPTRMAVDSSDPVTISARTVARA